MTRSHAVVCGEDVSDVEGVGRRYSFLMSLIRFRKNMWEKHN